MEHPFETPISGAEVCSSEARAGSPGHTYGVSEMMINVKLQAVPVRVRDASLVSTEALLADRLRHVLEELLPCPRCGVVMLCNVTKRLQSA